MVWNLNEKASPTAIKVRYGFLESHPHTHKQVNTINIIKDFLIIICFIYCEIFVLSSSILLLIVVFSFESFISVKYFSL